MQSKFLKRALSFLLAAAMIVGLASGTVLTSRTYAADGSGKKNVSFTKVGNNGSGLYFATKEAANVFAENYVKNGTVRVSIELLDEPVLVKGFSTRNIAANSAAVSYSKTLRAKQDALATRISKEVLGGQELDVVWNITLSANIISANVPYDKIEAIRNVSGVRSVFVETMYEPTADEVNMTTASSMTGTTFLWADGYTGAGSKVAIVDTGLDIYHELFDADAFEYAIEETGKNVDLLTVDDIAAVIDQLHIAGDGRISGITAEDLYISSKIPFGANYVDNDLDVTHENDSQGEHGSHVTGIAAGNRYIPDGEGGFVESADAVGAVGQAPDAQIIVMKVFGKGGGAYDSDYVVAIEDAIMLGADSVNLSLGSAVAGMAVNDAYEDIFNSFADSDTVVSISSGNNSYWAEQTYYGNLYYDDVNYATNGSPGSYPVALTVASVDNGGYSYFAVDFFGFEIKGLFTESLGYGNDPISTLAGEQEYIVIDGYGTEEEFEAVADLVEGKIAVVSRGVLSFYEKVNNAAEYGAIGVIVYNNTSGIINMNLTGVTTTIPAVSITQDDGSLLMYFGEEGTADDVTYYTGSLEICVSGEGEAKMSSFSSWGVPGDLSLKPEISAPGGSIYSVNGDHSGVYGHDNYEAMSGTSMAAPQITGIAAVMGEYIRENGLEEKTGLTARQLITSLLMSTANPQKDPAYDTYYPVMQQGAGLVNVNAAANAKSFITIDEVAETAPLSAADSIADGKVKVELGAFTDDVAYAVFSIHNFSDETVSYYLGADFFTQYIGDSFRYTDTDAIYPVLTWYIDGEQFEVSDSWLYDFNGDGVANILDAQRLLDYIVDDEVDLNYLEWFADFDGDDDIDTYDARLAFEMLGSASFEIEAGDTVQIVLEISGLEEELGYYSEISGNYLEGYIYACEGDSEDGALGVRHSIPVFGFYGDWSQASMFDRASYAETLADELYFYPYLYDVDGEETLYRQSFLINYPDISGTYMFGGNPLDSEDYMPERNAINAETVVKSAYYTLIRNAGAVRFYVENKYGKIVYESYIGSDYAAYYDPNSGQWNSTSATASLGFIVDMFKQGDSFTLNFQAVPEYYIDADGNVLWDEVSKEGTTFSMPAVYDNEAPFIVGAVYDEETGELVFSAHDDQYIAAVVLYTEDGSFLDYYGSVADIRKGEQIDYLFDLNELFDGEEIEPHLLVEVYDYAANLSTYKINLNPEELVDPELSVVIDPEQALIINSGSVKLKASVYPWGFEDETVYWASLNEDVAVVDENGLVTSTYEGDEESAFAVIEARSAVDETAVGYALVNVKIVNKDLNGIVWDETGSIWVSEFNIATIPEYEKLSQGNIADSISSMAYGSNGVLYATSFDTENQDSVFYSVDPETWEFTELGASGCYSTDLCMAPGISSSRTTYMYATYGPYVMILNAATGSYAGLADVSNYINGSYVVGIAYEGSEYDNNGRLRDYVFLVDTDGYLYEMSLFMNRGKISYSAPYEIAKIGDSIDVFYWQSLYFDGEDIYWSRFKYADDYVEMVMVDDVYTSFNCAVIGRFADQVWPVSGLFELESEEASVEPTSVGMFSGMKAGIPVDEPEKFKTVTSGVNAAVGTRPVAEIKKTVTEVTVEVRAEELSKNGFVAVEIPETAELVSVVSHAQYSSSAFVTEDNQFVRTPSAVVTAPSVNAVTSEEMVPYSTLLYAFVDLEGIEEDDPILTLKFAMGSTGTVFIYTEDINEDDEQLLVETVILGVDYAWHMHHTFDVDWTWYEDDGGEMHADAYFVCTLGDGAEFYADDVNVTKEVLDSSILYTASIVVDDVEYTDTYEIGIAKINARSANFGEELGVNFLLKIADEITADEDAYAVVTFNDADYEYLLSDCVAGERYKITKTFALKEYLDEMVLHIFDGEGNLITLYDKEGNDVTEAGYVFSMAEYLGLAKNSTNEKMAALAKAFEDYGNAAMIKFDHNAENLTVSDAVGEVTLEDLEDYAPVYGENNNLDTVVGDSTTITYSARLVLNKYFTFAEGTDVSDYKFYINGEEVEAFKVNDVKYGVKYTAGIDLKYFDRAIKFTVSDGTNTFEVNYSILSYSYKALASDTSTEEMTALAQATYLVYLAAADFFS